MKTWGEVNRILLGLLMLIPGLMKLFVSGPAAITGFMASIPLFAWAPAFWAWILMLSEILFGIAILARYRLEYTTIPPMIILAVAALFVNIQWSNLAATSWPVVLLHIVVISNYMLLGCYGCKKKK